MMDKIILFWLIVAYVVFPAHQCIATSSAASSSLSQIKTAPDESELLHNKDRKRRRRRDGGIIETKSTSDLNTSEASSLLINRGDVLAADNGSSHKTAFTRKRKRRRRTAEPTVCTDEANNDDVLLPFYDEDEYETDVLLPLPPEKIDVLVKEEELYCQNKSTPMTTTEASDSLPSKPLKYDQEAEIISSTTHVEDCTQHTKTEISDGPNPTISTLHQTSLESEKTELAESNDGQIVIFTHRKRKHSVQIITKSRLVDTNSSNKLTKEPKSQNTGKGGECLRRIKREWKDAVQMGIAYDWTKMKTIKSKESNSQNNYVRLGPFGKNLLRWHFSVLGPANSVYQNGVYHGRVLLPKDYPGSPPRVQVCQLL